MVCAIQNFLVSQNEHDLWGVNSIEIVVCLYVTNSGENHKKKRERERGVLLSICLLIYLYLFCIEQKHWRVRFPQLIRLRPILSPRRSSQSSSNPSGCPRWSMGGATAAQHTLNGELIRWDIDGSKSYTTQEHGTEASRAHTCWHGSLIQTIFLTSTLNWTWPF